MQEPSLRTSRLAIAGGLAAAIVLAGAGFVAGRMTSPGAGPDPAPRPTDTALPTPAVTEASRALDRAALIALGNGAADALASGAALPAEVSAAAGKRFDIVLPFGCTGPAPEETDAPLWWRYDAGQQTLRVQATPARWQAADWGLAPAGASPAAAGPRFEGFWLSRPWSSSDQCPQTRGQAAAVDRLPVTLPGQTLALAEILPDGTARRERPYQTVQRMAAADISATQSFRLRLTGRVERLPDGQPVQCTQPAGIEQRPICLIVVSFDEIRMENPLTGEMLATWSTRKT